MISDNQSICPKCGGQLKYYDHVQRLVRTKFGNKKWVAIRRLRCCNAMQFIESFLTLYFRIYSMNQTLLSACSKVLLLVKLWGLKIILVK